MIDAKTIQNSLYAAAVVVILTLTGIFTLFAEREVIIDGMTLDFVLLVVMLGVPALINGLRLRDEALPKRLANGVVSSLIVAAALMLVVLGESVIREILATSDAAAREAGERIDREVVFANYRSLIPSLITFGYEGGQVVLPGFALLTGFAALIGGLVTGLTQLPARLRSAFLLTLSLTVVVGLLESQIDDVMMLPDALALVIALGGGYIAARILQPDTLPLRLAFGAVPGAVLGALLAILAGTGAFASFNSFWVFGGDLPVILNAPNPLLPFIIGFGVVGSMGALLTVAPPVAHNGGLYLGAVLLLLGILNAVGEFSALMGVVGLVIFGGALWGVPLLANESEKRYELAPSPQRKNTNRIAALAGLAVVLVAPIFLGQYISYALDLVMLYIIMGIGLNVMVGFAGLLDLGYVASFAIGAYTSALLTTPSIITTGCVADGVEQYRYFEMCVGAATQWQGLGLFDFWGAWPLAILVSGLTGMALGLPVLRLRGDYLAIVTLGFGQITAVLTRAQVTKPVLGAAQGISPVPFPTLDLTWLNPEWMIEFNNASSIYYLYVFSVLIAAYVVMRLAGTRLGRAWRAMKGDEDVAEAMGVRLVATKLLAFGISSAFAGMGGALFVAQVRGIFPDSFTLMVSINVLSLIIIGGLGSIPGVILGALVLVGMPEVLRELQDYRLLVFGSLLVIAMLAKPDGLIPPAIPKLSEFASRKKQEPEPETPTATQGAS